MSDVRKVIEGELRRALDAGTNMDDSQVYTSTHIIIAAIRRAALAQAGSLVLHIEPRVEPYQKEVTPFVEAILDGIGLKLTNEPKPEGEAIRAEDV